MKEEFGEYQPWTYKIPLCKEFILTLLDQLRRDVHLGNVVRQTLYQGHGITQQLPSADKLLGPENTPKIKRRSENWNLELRETYANPLGWLNL